MLLTVKNLFVNYGGVKAIKGISLEVKEGSVVTLIGSNGVGKSTVLNAISGIIRPASGEIWFSGKRIDKLPPSTIVQMGIGHVPEGRRVFPYMTVMENLRLGAFTVKDKKNIGNDLEEIFELFPILKQREKQMGGTLSGGEQSMLAIGRGLMARPKLVLMDEPSLGLAPLMVAEVGKTISKIQKQGRTVILVEQNAKMALDVSDEAYLLEIGTVVLQGPAKDLENDERIKKIYLGG
jgi:branched-chain amino acid transport system ATP-binding protein